MNRFLNVWISASFWVEKRIIRGYTRDKVLPFIHFINCLENSWRTDIFWIIYYDMLGNYGYIVCETSILNMHLWLCKYNLYETQDTVHTIRFLSPYDKTIFAVFFLTCLESSRRRFPPWTEDLAGRCPRPRPYSDMHIIRAIQKCHIQNGTPIL